jgi:hypothetical protein
VKPVALYFMHYSFGRVHQTLRVTPAMGGVVRMTDNPTAKEREELAWAAGFFDGEGHVGFVERTCDMQIGISQNTRDVLIRFRAAVGRGSVTGPYHKARGGAKNPHYRFSVRGKGVTETMNRLLEWLSTPKREQYHAVKAKVDAGRAARKARKSN